MRRAEISAPAMFGRLPDQRDYVRWRVSANEGQVWQAWLNQQTWLGQGRHIVLPEGTEVAKAGINDGWLHLSPREKTVQPEHHPLPWSFVLSPGFLPIGGRDEWLTGVLTASRDSTGRPWPLVIYQRAGREWLEESLDDTQGWLYWLARRRWHHRRNGADDWRSRQISSGRCGDRGRAGHSGCAACDVYRSAAGN